MYAQALQVIATGIEEQLGLKVDKFTIVYNPESHKVEFQINDFPTRIPYDLPELADGIKAFIDSNANSSNWVNLGYTIKYVFVLWVAPRQGITNDPECKLAMHFVHAGTGDIKKEIVNF